MGCSAISATQPALQATSDSFCQVDKKISWSRKDTDQTIREVKTHNSVYTGLCDAKPKD